MKVKEFTAIALGAILLTVIVYVPVILIQILLQ